MSGLNKFAIAAVTTAMMSTCATAATYTFTEGNGNNRKLVAGANQIDLEDANNSTPGFDIDGLAGQTTGFGANDVVQLHGRIVSSQDVFSYTFAFAQGFKVEFDLDGYTLATDTNSSDGDDTESLSGLVGQDGRFGNPKAGISAKGVAFTLTNTADNSFITRPFTTDILDGEDPFIFAGLGGVEYTLTVDGSVGPQKGADALYDLKISAVPIPAAGFMLLGGIGGLAALRRRKGKAKT